MTTTQTATPGSPAPSPPRRYQHFIGGAWVEPRDVIARHAPATGLAVAEFGAGSRAEIDEAVRAARAAFDTGEWPRQNGAARAAVLLRLADLIEAEADHLAGLDAEEAGKPIRIARNDVAGAAGLTRYAAGLATQLHGMTYANHDPDFLGLVLREPAGVAGLITPWNFPALILCQKLPFALAAGCTVVVKPSELTSSSTLEIARMAAEAGLPDGVLNVVTGDGHPGQALAEHPGVDVVSFTGSTATGRKIIDAAKPTLKRVSLELGGKSASTVFADADLDDAVDGVLFGVFFNQGECCVSGSRLLVEDHIADEFVARVADAANRLKVGQPLDPSTDVGAMISPGHLDKVLGYVESGLAGGAGLRAGGARLSGPGYDEGLFIAPTVFDAVTPEMRVFTEEIFGPVLSVTRFHDVDEAITLANQVEYGLANTIWSKNIDKVVEVSRALKSGTVYVNTTIDGAPQLPFGGYKASGVGREMGEAGLEEFTELKSLNIRTGSRKGTFLFDAKP